MSETTRRMFLGALPAVPAALSALLAGVKKPADSLTISGALTINNEGRATVADLDHIVPLRLRPSFRDVREMCQSFDKIVETWFNDPADPTGAQGFANYTGMRVLRTPSLYEAIQHSTQFTGITSHISDNAWYSTETEALRGIWVFLLRKMVMRQGSLAHMFVVEPRVAEVLHISTESNPLADPPYRVLTTRPMWLAETMMVNGLSTDVARSNFNYRYGILESDWINPIAHV